MSRLERFKSSSGKLETGERNIFGLRQDERNIDCPKVLVEREQAQISVIAKARHCR